MISGVLLATQCRRLQRPVRHGDELFESFQCNSQVALARFASRRRRIRISKRDLIS